MLFIILLSDYKLNKIMIIFDYSIFAIPVLVYVVTKSFFAFCIIIAFCTYFMYSPNLMKEYDVDLFYSPSNGTVRTIRNDGRNTVISLFLNVLDNHTQYIPIKSKFISQKSIYGPFKPAFMEHSINNEQVETTLEATDYNFKYKIEQITGLLTRRIKNLLDNQSIFMPGARLGFIVLGSRVDISLPTSQIKRLLIQPGQHIKAMQKIIEIA